MDFVYFGGGGGQPGKAGGKEEGVETDTFRIFQHLAKTSTEKPLENCNSDDFNHL